jgi:hypothetical protein
VVGHLLHGGRVLSTEVVSRTPHRGRHPRLTAEAAACEAGSGGIRRALSAPLLYGNYRRCASVSR